MSDAQLFRQLVEALPNGILVFDLDGSILYANRIAQEFLKLREKHSSHDRDEEIRAFLGSARNGETFTVTIAEHPLLLTYHDRMENGQPRREDADRCDLRLYLFLFVSLLCPDRDRKYCHTCFKGKEETLYDIFLA